MYGQLPQNLPILAGKLVKTPSNQDSMKYDPALHHRRSIRLRGYDYRREGMYFITICAQHRRCLFGHIENKVMILNEYGRVAYQEWEKLPERWPHVELGAFQIMPNHLHGIIIIHDVGAPLAGAQPTGAQPTDHATGAQPTDQPTGAQPTDHATGAQPMDHATGVQPTDHATGAQPTDHVAGAQKAGENDSDANDSDDGARVERARVERAPARGAPTADENGLPATAPTEIRDTQIQWAHRPTLGQMVGAYQSCVSTQCLKIAKSKQPERILGKLWQRNFWEHIIRTVDAFDNISNYIIWNPDNWEADRFYKEE